MTSEIEQGRIAAGDLEFGYLAAGDAADPLALCMHGFPDSPYTWEALLPKLAAAGYRAVAPFMRGYAPTSIPADGQYSYGALAHDVCNLHDALDGDDRSIVIGHDWGAVATHSAANFQPERFARLVTSSVPPGMTSEAFTSYDQVKRSFYIFLFQLPMAELLVSLDDLGFIERFWGDWCSAEHATVLAHAKDAIRDPGHLTAAISYYRQIMGEPIAAEHQAAQETSGQLPSMPLLYLHGKLDESIGVELAPDVSALAAGSRVELFEHSNHFPHLEEPAKAHQLVLDFVAR